MKKSRIIIPALGLIALGTAASITGTVAWFSANTQVTVTGMSVTTSVSSNLQIAAINAEANYSNSLAQTRSGSLRPTSTVAATSTSYFYHALNTGISGTGAATDATWVAYSEAEVKVEEVIQNGINDTNAGKDHYDKAFNDAYGVTGAIAPGNVVYGYIDYVFFIKATSTANDQVLKMTTCNLLYNSAAITEKAWRVAVLAQASAKDTNTAGDGTKVTILAPNGAANFTPNQAVDSATTKASVTYGTAAVIDDDVDIGDSYFKVVVRLWLEGEDTTCNNTTFATLTNSWTLDLAFELGADNTGAVTEIGSVAP